MTAGCKVSEGQSTLLHSLLHLTALWEEWLTGCDATAKYEVISIIRGDRWTASSLDTYFIWLAQLLSSCKNKKKIILVP